MDPKTRYQQARRITIIGAVVNAVLAGLKIVFGLWGRSQALVADGVHSLSDLFTDALVLVASRYGSQDPDLEHPYGHERIETAATMFLALVLTLVGVGIMYEACYRLFTGTAFTPDKYVLFVAFFSMLANEGLYYYTKRVADKIGSNLVCANAWHHRSDAASSAVVIIGIIGALLGFSYFDAIAAFIVGGFIIQMGWQLGWSSIRELIDTGVNDKERHLIQQTIISIAGVKAIHQLRTRSMGGRILIDVHVLVDSKLSVSEGHHIAQQVHYRLMDALPAVTDVTVHIDPEDDEINPPSLHLPDRQQLLQQLAVHWQGLAGSDQIQGVVLHYLAGQVAVEIHLPLNLVKEQEDIDILVADYRDVLLKVTAVAVVEVYFVDKKISPAECKGDKD